MPAKKTAAKAATTAQKAQTQENILGQLGQTWRAYNLVQINFAEENVKAYFDAMREVVEAKSVGEATKVYGKFAVQAGRRQAEQARTLGKMALETARGVGAQAVSRLRNVRG